MWEKSDPRKKKEENWNVTDLSLKKNLKMRKKKVLTVNEENKISRKEKGKMSYKKKKKRGLKSLTCLAQQNED